MGGVHDVGFHKNDGSIIEAVGKEVAGIEERARAYGADVVSVGRVNVGGKSGDFRKDFRDGFPDERLFLVGALEEFFK